MRALLRTQERAGATTVGSLALGLVLALALAAPRAEAQTATQPAVFTSPPNPVGAGARATGAGSAFVAIADDATAASWNPAGLVQLERPEVSAVARWSGRQDDFSDGGAGNRGVGDPGGVIDEIEPTRGRVEELGLNYLSAAFPFAWSSHNLAVSLNYQQMYSFERDLSFRARTRGPGFSTSTQIDFEQVGGVDAVSPAIAAEVTTDLSVGAALNFWLDGLGRSYAWKSRARQSSTSTRDDLTEPIEADALFVNRFEGFRGINATFGILWHPHREWSVGSAVELPLEARVRVVSETENLLDGTSGRLPDRLEIILPASYAAGVAFRATDSLVLSSDVTVVDWGDFRRKDGHGDKRLVTGDPVGQADVDPTVTVRVGAEQLVAFRGWILALRAGGFYDPEPSGGAPEDVYGGSVGLGVTVDTLNLDLAYQVRYGAGLTDVSALNEEPLRAPSGELDLLQQSALWSVVYYF